MATIKSKFTDKLSLNVQHEYITLKTPNGTFTTSYRGAKATGKLAIHPTAFNALDKFVHSLPKGSTYGERMEELLNPKVLATMFPEWDEALKVVDIGDTVTFTEKTFLKRYPVAGEVKSIKRKYAYVLFPNEKAAIGFDMAFLVKV